MPSFASKSLPVHLARGIAGFGSIGASIALGPVVGWVSLLLLPVGLIALRGCPMCWAIGLVQTIFRGRLQRECADGRCRLTSATKATATVSRQPEVAGQGRESGREGPGAARRARRAG